MKRKRKRLVSILLIVGVLLGAVAGIVALTGRDKADEGFELVDVSFERGGLDASGKYVEGKSSIYTKESFECGTDVRIKLDFDSNVKYKVFFYGSDDTFIEASEELDKTTTVTTPENAVCARLVVTPIWESDVEDDDQIIRVWNINKYAKQLTVMIAPIVEAE